MSRVVDSPEEVVFEGEGGPILEDPVVEDHKDPESPPSQPEQAPSGSPAGGSSPPAHRKAASAGEGAFVIVPRQQAIDGQPSRGKK